MAAESGALDAWLYGLLSGDSALSSALATLAIDAGHPATWAPAWYPEEAPQGTPHPFGVWTWTFGPDVWALGGERAVVRPTLRVMVIAAGGDYQALRPVADRVDALLHGATANATGILVYQCLRKSEIRRAGLVEGVRYRQLGGEYELVARSQ